MQRFAFPTPVVATLAALTLATSAFGTAPPAPTSGFPAGEHVIFLSSPNMNYLVSDFGWSDSWLTPPQLVYPTSSVDVLTGDDAANIHYTINGQQMPAVGHGWLTHTIDGGTGDPSTNTGSAWTVLTPTPNSANDKSSATSVVTDTNLVVTITTTLTGLTLRQTYHITNNTSNLITNLNLADYLNFHPGGTAKYGNIKDTVQPKNFGVAQVLTAGAGSLYFSLGSPQPSQPDPIPLVADGYMGGDRFPDAWTIGAVSDVLDNVDSQKYNDAYGPTSSTGGDVAGAFDFNLGTLQPGASVDISINKGLGDPPVPEPASLGLLACGALTLLHRKQRIR